SSKKLIGNYGLAPVLPPLVDPGVVFVVEIGAKGFGLPSSPVGTKRILESFKPAKTLSEKIESSNLMFFTLSNTERKSCVTLFISLVVGETGGMLGS
ncbi:MAG: hypothetical protein AAB873_02525, partial [Patescibacteria group bacterium]